MSKDIWMYLLSAAIGGIISFLVLKFWNSPETEATRKPKVKVEHDERQRWKTVPTCVEVCVEELRRDERKEKRLINCRILVCD